MATDTAARWPVAAMPLAPSARAALSAAGVATAADVAAFVRRHANADADSDGDADAADAADAAAAAPSAAATEHPPAGLRLARALEAEGLLRGEDAAAAAPALLAWCAGAGAREGEAEAARQSVRARLPPAMHPPPPPPAPGAAPLTAAEMLRRHRARVAPAFISTGSAALDALLAGVSGGRAGGSGGGGGGGGGAGQAAAAAGGGGGGVPLGRVTEFVGAPGLGKTQLAMTLCVNAVLSSLGGEAGCGAAGGGGGGDGSNGSNANANANANANGNGNGGDDGLAEALYLDTEGSFTPERVADIAGVAVERRWILSQQGGGGSGGNGAAAAAAAVAAARVMPPALRAAQVEAVMGSVLWFRARDDCDMLALWHMLPALMDAHPRARLVVADSVAAPLRQAPWTRDAPARSRLLAWLASSALALAEGRGAAFVLINQVVTRGGGVEGEGGVGGGGGGGGGPSSLAPALGEAWGQAAAVRVSLAWRGEEGRVASLLKHPASGPGEARYAVGDGGLTDV